MKRIFAVVLLCAMILSVFAAFGAAKQAEAGVVDGNTYPQENAVIENLGYVDPDLEGKPTSENFVVEEDPTNVDTSWYTSTEAGLEFTLTTPAQLRGFFKLRGNSDKTSFEGQTIRLGADLKMDSTVSLAQKLGTGYIFKGTFDGGIYDENGNLTGRHIISGLSLYNEKTGERGLFGQVGGNAVMKNIAFIDCSVVNYSVFATKTNVGGLFSKVTGESTANVTIQNVYNDIDVTCIMAAGSATETNTNEKTITSASGLGFQVGGFFGLVASGTVTIDNCVYAGEINAAAHRVGGFVGCCSASTVNITNCEFKGNLNPLRKIWVGGKNEDHQANRTDSGITYIPAEVDVSSLIVDWGAIVGYTNTDATVTLTNVEDGGWLRVALDSGYANETGSVNTSWYLDNSALKEYTITTPEQFRGFMKLRTTNTGTTAAPVYPYTFEGQTIKLGNDINLDSTKALSNIAGASEFKGTFDGCGYVIGGGYINSNGSGTRSFFGTAKGSACVKNVSFVNCRIDAYTLYGTTNGQKTNVGGIFTKVEGNGVAETSGTVIIENVYNDIDIEFVAAKFSGYDLVDGTTDQYEASDPSAIGRYVAGFIPTVNNSKVRISNCVYAGTIEAAATEVAGFVACPSNNAVLTIENCENRGELTPLTTIYLGGTNAKNSENRTSGGDTYLPTEKNIASSLRGWGGYIGYIMNNNLTLTISNSKNYANVTSYQSVGGFIGDFYGNAANKVQNVTIQNCYNEGTITATGNGNVGGAIGYMRGKASTAATQNLEIIGFENNGVIKAPGKKWVGGCIGSVDAVNYAGFVQNITLQNVVNSQTVSGTSNIGGIIGSLKSAGTTTLQQCTNKADITGTSTSVAGMVGYAATTNALYGSLEILGCKNTGNIKGTSELGAAVGTTVIDSVKIDGFINSGDVTRSTETVGSSVGSWVGGIGGYIHGQNGVNLTDTVSITNCKNTGIITGNRCVGGLVGMAQHIAVLTVANCYSMGDIDAHVTNTSNPYIGGLLGVIAETGTATVNGNTFGGNLTVNTNIKATTAVTVYAGGLIGGLRRDEISVKVDGVSKSLYVQEGCDEKYDEFLFDDNTIKVDGITTGDLNWNLTEKITVKETVDGVETEVEKTCVAGTVTRDAYCATIASEQSLVRPEFARNTLVSDTGKCPDGMTVMQLKNVTEETYKFSKRMIMKIGAQYYHDAEANTYNLRYIFAVDGLQETDDKALGFVVTRNTFADGDASPKGVTKTLYCPNVYKTLKGETEIYNAEDYGADYFFTLELQEIPAEYLELVNGRYMLKDTDLRIYPFVNSGELEGDKPENATAFIGHTDSIAWENRIEYYQNDFSKTKPEKFANATGLIKDIKWKTDVLQDTEVGTSVTHGCVSATAQEDGSVALKNACTNKEEGHVCTPFVAQNVTAVLDGANARYHYYPNTKVGGNRQTAFFRVAINTTELEGAGTYDFCFQVHLKDNNARGIRIQINDQKYHEQTIMLSDTVNYGAVCADYNTADSATRRDAYLTGFSAELDAGVNYITFRMPYVHSDFDVSTWHIRDIYVVKSAAAE